MIRAGLPPAQPVEDGDENGDGRGDDDRGQDDPDLVPAEFLRQDRNNAQARVALA